MTDNYQQKTLGILGGMGPLASSEFLKTIYEYNLLGRREQESPKVLVYSDPTFPDRTEVLLGQDYHLLLTNLIEALDRLCELEVSKIVICCITSHYLLPKIPDLLRERIISLVDVILIKTLEQQKKHLLICSNGTRKLEIFQNHSLWPLAKDYILLPDKRDQNIVHQMIYSLKRNGNVKKCIPIVESLLFKYNVNNLIAGCTEIHLLTKYLYSSVDNQKNDTYLDPLIILAKELLEDFQKYEYSKYSRFVRSSSYQI
jgi:aspartate racemase